MSVWLVSKGLIVESTTITISDIYLIGATLVAPIFAVHAQKWLDTYKEKYTRKLYIFETLMTTRVSKLSEKHVEALNLIDVYFHHTACYFFQKKKAKNVTKAWKEYRTHLYDSNMRESNPSVWENKSHEIFAELLYQISLFMNYTFDKVDIMNSFYHPLAYDETEHTNNIIANGLKGIFNGENVLPITIKKTSK